VAWRSGFDTFLEAPSFQEGRDALPGFSLKWMIEVLVALILTAIGIEKQFYAILRKLCIRVADLNSSIVNFYAMTGPLTSLKILDFSTLIPGPFASMVLADLGADVLRVEAPNRPDMIRAMPPFDDGQSAWHSVINRNKRSLALDLKDPDAAGVIARLVQEYDIVLEQFRPGVMDRLGVGYAALRAANPRLIYCAISGYGQTGPSRDRAAHDINLMALSGIASHSGTIESGPPPLGVQVVDVGSSFMAITGMLAAVIHRSRTGEGQFVDVSMFDTALTWNTLAASQYLVGGDSPAPEGEMLNGGSFYGYYRTRDDRFLSVGSLEPKFWTGFCAAIERPDLLEAGFDLTPAAQQRLKAELRSTIAQRPLDEWRTIFAALDLCVEPVLTTEEACAHPQTTARGMVIEAPKPDGGTQRQIGAPIKFSASNPTYRHIGVTKGKHTEEVMAGLAESRH